MNILTKAYEINKKTFHALKHIPNAQLHHIFGRDGWRLACIHCFACGYPGHQDDQNFVQGLRDKYREDEKKIAGTFTEPGNFVKGQGCKARIFETKRDKYGRVIEFGCDLCGMPIIGETNENRIAQNNRLKTCQV